MDLVSRFLCNIRIAAVVFISLIFCLLAFVSLLFLVGLDSLGLIERCACWELGKLKGVAGTGRRSTTDACRCFSPTMAGIGGLKGS